MKRSIAIIVLLASILVLVFGIFRLFTLRFEIGDVYPEYSSLRSDPLGTMALYESLQRLPELTVVRDFSRVSRFPNGTATTCFYLAMPLRALQVMPEGAFRDMERFVVSGGRLVITMFPAGTQFVPPIETSQPGEKRTVPAYQDRWGVDVEIINLQRFGNTYLPETVQNISGLDLPETVEWYSGIVFKNLNPDWKPIYVRDTHPVMIQRSFGRGAVVIATDSFFLSNEAMLLDRHADLLAFLIGTSRNVVFDEAHLGVTENPGMATLIRRYRLHWVIASLILVAILFIWKMSIPLLPVRDAGDRLDYVAGKDATEGIINLLRRSIPRNQLLETCFDEWKKSAPKSGQYSAERIQQAEAAFHAEKSAGPKDRDVAAAYRTISKILQTRNQ